MSSKYKAKPVIIDNIRFASTAEGNRYQQLKMLEKCGKIKDLVLQPAYVLLNDFVYKGKKVKGITYKADFKYIENKQICVEDVKGVMTRDFILKAKLFLRTGIADNFYIYHNGTRTLFTTKRAK